MRHFFLGAIASLLLSLAGCGTQVLSGAAAERLRNPVPYGARWVKEGMTRESRKADWVACGGGGDLQNGFRKLDYASSETLESYLPKLDSHTGKLTDCIKSKGYEFKYYARPGKADECNAAICLYP